MPAFVKTPEDEERWARAKKAVKRARKKQQSEFTDQDWGLTTHIFQRIKKANSWLFKAKEYLEGGKADNKPDSKYSKKQLKMGKKVEREHTSSPKKAKEIAKDHLEEHDQYYTFLHGMEKLLEKKKELKKGARLSSASVSAYKPPKGMRLGTTKSGAPIMHDPSNPAHQNYSRQDHIDAYFEHGNKLKMMDPKVSNPADIEHHTSAMQHHWQASMGGMKKARHLGQTRNGHFVHANKSHDSHAYKRFKKEDHHDAANMHHKEAMRHLAEMKKGGKNASAHHKRFVHHFSTAHGHAEKSLS